MDDLVEQVLAARREEISRQGLSKSLVVAGLLHLAALMAVVLAPEARNTVTPKEYVAVQAVPLAALGAPKPRTSQPTPVPPPKPPAQVEEPPPAKPAPVLPKPEAVKPQPAATAAKPTAAPAKPTSSGQAAPTTPAAPGDQREGMTAGSSTSSAAFGSTRLEGIDPEFTYDYYLDRMLGLIHAQWQPPATEGDVRAVLRFTVLKTGEIVDLELDTTSGSNAFDLAAMRAVQNASPLPPLPASYRRGQLTVTLIVH